MRSIKTGNSDKGDTAVQGINPGEVVANSSFEKLQNGSQISLSKIKLPSGATDSTGSPAQ
jgi:multidrug efflux system membrane fusion protein